MATQEEIESWKKFVASTGIKSIDIPYVVTVGAVTIVGVFHLRDPFEDSSTEGAVAGAIIGTYNLDRNNGTAEIYDPTRNLLRLVIVLDLPGRELKARIDTRQWTGGWSEGSWAIIWRG